MAEAIKTLEEKIAAEKRRAAYFETNTAKNLHSEGDYAGLSDMEYQDQVDLQRAAIHELPQVNHRLLELESELKRLKDNLAQPGSGTEATHSQPLILSSITSAPSDHPSSSTLQRDNDAETIVAVAEFGIGVLANLRY